jgi:hypothetical protein
MYIQSTFLDQTIVAEHSVFQQKEVRLHTVTQTERLLIDAALLQWNCFLSMHILHSIALLFRDPLVPPADGPADQCNVHGHERKGHDPANPNPPALQGLEGGVRSGGVVLKAVHTVRGLPHLGPQLRSLGKHRCCLLRDWTTLLNCYRQPPNSPPRDGNH